MSTQPAVVSGLRAWAKGAFDQEAGVELLVRAFGGRFVQSGCPWVRPCEMAGWFWIDVAILVRHVGVFSGGEERVLAIAAALIDGRSVDNLGGMLAGLDRPTLHLVLAALAHAAGSHEQVDLVTEGGRVRLRPLPCLVPWPDQVGRAA